MVIDEDPIPLVASINVVATDLKAMLNAKNDGRFFLETNVTPPLLLAAGVPATPQKPPAVTSNN